MTTAHDPRVARLALEFISVATPAHAPEAPQPATHCDRSKWGTGPWNDEPTDRIEWRDALTEMPCLMVRNNSGAWCGYVGVSPGHPYHDLDYNEVATLGYVRDADGEIDWGSQSDNDIDVHGGLTYSGKCAGKICHVPLPGESADVTWFGFDCAHSSDLAPDTASFAPYKLKYKEITYPDIDYVQNEVTALCWQLAVVAAVSADVAADAADAT